MPSIDKELQPYISDIVRNAMLTAWNEICADSKCHPLDIEQDFEGKKRHLGFTPKHWARMTGDIVAHQVEEFFKASRKERAKKIGQFVMTGTTVT